MIVFSKPNCRSAHLAGSLLNLGLFPCANPAAASCAPAQNYTGTASYCPTTNGTGANNGNLQSQTISFPGFNATQTYTYDSLNRLCSVAESTGWSQSYQYVGNPGTPYPGSGNRWVSASAGLPTLTPETPTSASAYTSSPVINRINTWSYDNNGNVVTIPMGGTSYRNFTYDAENRQASATIFDQTTNTTTTATYLYDGLGQRVSKTMNGTTTTYVYDAFGNLTLELGPAEPSPCGTAPPCYVTVDHLGSTRMLTDSTGAVQRRYDYLPFGGELLANTGNRTPAMGYSSPMADDFGPKFTSQSRDPETTLDWFNVRHMSGAQGRFQSVDPGNAGANGADPQTWNMYAYVGNNPMSYTDPSGAGPETAAACAWGPVPCIVGVVAGFFAELGIFGHSSHTPGLAGVPVPNQSPGASSGGGPLGPSDQPWDEKVPIGNSGGGFNIGGVFGSGNTGPFIFSFEESSGLRDWAAGAKDAFMMTFDWHWGLGPQHRTFGPGTVEVKNMQHAPGVEKARQYFYNKNPCGGAQPVYNYRAGFGLKGLLSAGLNPTRQFIGDYRVDITPNSAGDAATFTLTNTTSFTSFLYGIGPSWQRQSGVPTPMGNMSQTYYWTESIPTQRCGGAN